MVDAKPEFAAEGPELEEVTYECIWCGQTHSLADGIEDCEVRNGTEGGDTRDAL